MTGSSRRIYVYWLLLLVPTLVVGAGALVLLRREQARLDEQARATAEARRGAVAARARLIAENVELLVGDVESGLMATLLDAPATNPDAFLDEWERNNPLVHASFRLGPDDKIVRPSADSKRNDMRPWLDAWIASGAPWRGGLRQEAVRSQAEEMQRRDVTSNVAQVQNARNALKDVASQGINLKKQSEATVAEQTGWTTWRDGNRMHLIGWRQPAFGGVLGVDVEVTAIADRLGELLPKEGDFADAFAVRETGGVTLQSKVYASSSFSRATEPQPPLVTVPISGSILPGWEIVGFARGAGGSGGAGGGFFVIGALMVAIFVAAILSGGWLLLWQARRSDAEAAQKTSFVANVSHEFKTPLTTIRLYAELLEQGRVRDAAQGGDYLRTIGRETQRLARLVNNALDFSRLEQGRKKYSSEAMDLTAEIARLLDTQEPRIGEAGLTLNRELPGVPLPYKTDRDALEQILLNLLDNACKYAASGGVLLVSLVSCAVGGVEVRVADRGPGVPVDHRLRIFEKFHRVDDTLTAEKGGAGLGLSIARQLARGLGGDLHHEPRAGGGAEFILKLP